MKIFPFQRKSRYKYHDVLAKLKKFPIVPTHRRRFIWFEKKKKTLISLINVFYLQKSVKPSAAAPSAAASRPHDEIYIDDDSIEGSGGRGGVSLPTTHKLVN